jgi:hypothetical protein
MVSKIRLYKEVQVAEKKPAELDTVKVTLGEPEGSSGLERSGGQQQPAHGETVTPTSESPDNQKQPPSKESRKPIDTDKAESQEKSEYDLVAGYYIVMGGFVTRCDIVISRARIEHFQPNFSGKHYCTLAPKAVEILAQAGHFLRVPTRTIQDKSKADFLAKGLACFQVLWMLVEASNIELNPLNDLDLTSLAERGSKTVWISLGATGSPHLCPRVLCAHHVHTVVQKTHGYSRPDST